METFDTVEGQNKAVAKASVKDYVDRMSLSELRKVEKFISDLRQTDCSQSALIDGLSCEYLNEDETCDYLDSGCDPWLSWNLDHRQKDEPIEHFCRLSVKERDKFSA